MGESPSLGNFGGNFGRKGERRKRGRERENDEEREKRGKEKRENGEEKKGNYCKRGGGKLKIYKWKGKGMKMSRGPYRGPFLFFSSFFWLVTFLKPLKLVWGVLFGNFYRENNREMGNFLTSPTFDCTPGYAPGQRRGHMHV